MVNVDEAVIARLKVQGQTFEILVDCDKALEFKKGKGDLIEILATTDIYKDVKKGEHASAEDLKRIFGSEDSYKIAEEIIKKGDIQITKEHKNKEREEKKRKIMEIIHRNAVNPGTNLPHPPQRIENAMNEAQVHIDEYKKAEDQVQDILEKIRPVLPIKFEMKKLAVKVPAMHAGKSYNVLKSYGKLLQDEWQNDGSLVAVVEIPAGMNEDFETELNKLSHGEVEIKEMEK